MWQTVGCGYLSGVSAIARASYQLATAEHDLAGTNGVENGFGAFFPKEHVAAAVPVQTVVTPTAREIVVAPDRDSVVSRIAKQ